VDVVSITKSSEFLLPGGIPAVESDTPTVGEEVERVHLYADGWLILLFEFTCQVTLYERRLSCPSISNNDELEAWAVVRGFLTWQSHELERDVDNTQSARAVTTIRGEKAGQQRCSMQRQSTQQRQRDRGAQLGGALRGFEVT
jgi:hypothetical protein